MLLDSARSLQSADAAVLTTALDGKRKERSPSSDETIKRRRANKGVTMQSQYQRMYGANSNTLLLPPLTPGASSNAEGDWKVITKRSKRKKRKEGKKSTVRKRAKPDVILVRSKDQSVTYATILKLMKDRVVKQQVAENGNKIRQTKTVDVLTTAFIATNT